MLKYVFITLLITSVYGQGLKQSLERVPTPYLKTHISKQATETLLGNSIETHPFLLGIHVLNLQTKVNSSLSADSLLGKTQLLMEKEALLKKAKNEWLYILHSKLANDASIVHNNSFKKVRDFIEENLFLDAVPKGKNANFNFPQNQFSRGLSNPDINLIYYLAFSYFSSKNTVYDHGENFMYQYAAQNKVRRAGHLMQLGSLINNKKALSISHLEFIAKDWYLFTGEDFSALYTMIKRIINLSVINEPYYTKLLKHLTLNYNYHIEQRHFKQKINATNIFTGTDQFNVEQTFQTNGWALGFTITTREKVGLLSYLEMGLYSSRKSLQLPIDLEEIVTSVEVINETPKRYKIDQAVIASPPSTQNFSYNFKRFYTYTPIVSYNGIFTLEFGGEIIWQNGDLDFTYNLQEQKRVFSWWNGEWVHPNITVLSEKTINKSHEYEFFEINPVIGLKFKTMKYIAVSFYGSKKMYSFSINLQLLK